MEEIDNEQFLINFLLFIGIISIIFYYFNRRIKVKKTAEKGQYSEKSEYNNMTPMKHDILQNLTLSLGIPLIIYLYVQKINGIETYFDFNDFIDFTNFRNFRLSIFGNLILSTLGFVIYYQILQPYVFNYMPKF